VALLHVLQEARGPPHSAAVLLVLERLLYDRPRALVPHYANTNYVDVYSPATNDEEPSPVGRGCRAPAL